MSERLVTLKLKNQSLKADSEVSKWLDLMSGVLTSVMMKYYIDIHTFGSVVIDDKFIDDAIKEYPPDNL